MHPRSHILIHAVATPPKQSTISLRTDTIACHRYISHGYVCLYMIHSHTSKSIHFHTCTYAFVLVHTHLHKCTQSHTNTHIVTSTHISTQHYRVTLQVHPLSYLTLALQSLTMLCHSLTLKLRHRCKTHSSD